ncbi:hypothetical protein L6R50_09505 [Myxococcota bacterium]|nr:hypothetical protein [Myxococcota bacterium]
MTFWEFLNAAGVSAIVASVVSGFGGFVSAWIIQRRAEWNSIDQGVDEIVRLGIEYPYLEDDEFCASWDPASRDERLLRYSSYCVFVFNVLERAWRYHDGDRNKIEERIGVKELVLRHQEWWKHPGHPAENIRGYPQGFRKFVKEYLQEG